MNKTTNYLQLLLSLSLLTITFATSAATPPLADPAAQEQIRQQERLNQLRQQQEIKPDARGTGDTLKSPAPTSATPISDHEIPDHETPCFPLHQIELIGDSAAQFKFALNEVLDAPNISPTSPAKPILGQCLGAVGINAVMSRVQNAIIAKGYVTTRVLAAPQDLTSGVLQLTVVAGRVNAIRFTTDSSKRANAWNAVPISKGDILNLRDIEQALENFKRVPTAEADIQIEPAPPANAAQSNTAQLGLSDVVIRYQQRSVPFRLSFNVDDSGANSTGKYQGGVTLSGDNLLTLNDLFYVNYNHDLGGGDAGKRGNDGFSAHYSLPWDYWLLSANVSGSDFHQSVAGATQTYVYSGSSQNAEIKLNRLIYRNRLNKTNLSIKGFFRKSNNFVDDTEIEVQRRRTAGWELGLNQSWYMGKAVLDYNLAYRRGTGAEDSLVAPEQAFGEGTSRMRMWLGDLNLTMPFELALPWGQQALQYSANLRGQSNVTPLTPQDRFSIGSRYTVRGFDGEQSLTGDHGWLIRNELVAPIANSGQSLYWGLDYGEVGGQSSQNLIGKYLAGTVIGLRGNGQFTGVKALSGLSYDVFIGAPVSKPAGYITHDTTLGFSFNGTY